MDIIRFIDVTLLKFSNKLGIKTKYEASKFTSNIFFIFAFFIILFTGNIKMIIISFFMFLGSVYGLRKYFKKGNNKEKKHIDNESSIFKSFVEKFSVPPKVDYSKMDIKDYALIFKTIYEELKVCGTDKKTELEIQLFDLLDAWSDKNIKGKIYTYVIIIRAADYYKVKALEELMQKAEGQIAEDEKYVNWFKEEAEKTIALKRQKGDSILDIDKSNI